MQSAILNPDLLEHPFGLAEDLPAMDTGWHTHARPQLLYATEGALRLWAEDRSVLLPPQRAAWIGAGLRHRVETGRPVRLRTVYFLPGDGAGGEPLAVFSAPPLLRELAVLACAWGPQPPELPEVVPFFAAFSALVWRWRQSPLAVDLPQARSPGLAAALAWLDARLDRPVGPADAAKVAGMSSRTLQRRCRAELGVSLQAWLGRARIVAALALLADPDLSIGEIAYRCGYASLSAFSRAFSATLGSPPSAWRSQGER